MYTLLPTAPTAPAPPAKRFRWVAGLAPAAAVGLAAWTQTQIACDRGTSFPVFQMLATAGLGLLALPVFVCSFLGGTARADGWIRGCSAVVVVGALVVAANVWSHHADGTLCWSF